MFTDFDIVKCSKRLRELRTDEGMSHETLAKRLGVSPQLLKNYEQAYLHNGVATGAKTDKTNAIAGMKIETLCKIAALFGVTTDYLLGLTEQKARTAEVQAISNYTGLSGTSIEALHNLNESSGIEKPFRQYAINKILSTKGFWTQVLDGLAKAYTIRNGSAEDLDTYLNSNFPKEEEREKIKAALCYLPMMNLAGYTNDVVLKGKDATRFFVNSAADLTKQLYELIVSGAVNELKEGANNVKQ